MAISPLPPLHCLLAFEATVRLSSFTRAAAELNLTQSAVSRQIALLETSLGRTLIQRKRNALVPTPAGEQYIQHVRFLLQECAEATAAIMKHNSENELTIASSSGIAQFWIPYHLTHFRRACPEIKINFIVRDRMASLSEFEFDAGIYYLQGEGLPLYESIKLFDEQVIAVCSPELLPDGKLVSAEQLADYPLLVLDDAQSQWMSWQCWFQAQGVMIEPSVNTMKVNHYPALIALSVMGNGIALAWRGVIDDLLDQKKLVLASDAEAGQKGGFHLITPRHRYEKRAVRMFKNWLLTRGKR
ncbi:MAG: Glycine cleavage system transcriptional activator [Candidatus Erwinia impunctatus]|nr:Glycine cleavage system transcriptional activator [Culicoides impunctatus]